MVRKVRINKQIVFGEQQQPFVLIAGPCVLEDQERVLKIGAKIKEITTRLGIPYIFKASYDKANRSSINSFRGPGLTEGLARLAQLKEELAVPVLTDIHQSEQAAVVAEVVDIIQVPAFLSRQTDLLLAAGKTGKIVNIKKGQFLAPHDIQKVVEKVESTGNKRILLTERGVSFGYNNLVVDMRSLPIMRNTGYPVVFDATHSVQLPGAGGDRSGGEREFVPTLTRAALGAGVDAVFIEVHDNPDQALSDGPNMVQLDQLERLLKLALNIDQIVKGR
ncbi:MAG: 3-deoxy-8-phosphooctulonate synthase [Halanaerobiales bacterium]|nr:3-deoxy-8-phosphooctulonate synthase [Halanaerobiales bacterium]